MLKRLRLISKVAFGLIFIGGGVNHFVDPAFYLAMMPSYIPEHELMVAASGVIEVVLGLSLLVPKVERQAAWGLIALLVAVFPANLNMALNAQNYPNIPELALWARLPMQGLLIWWASLYTKSELK